MWIILLIVLAGILAGYSLRMCAFLKKVNLTISCTICLMLFVLGLSVGYNPLIVGNLGSFGGQALLLSVAGITGSVWEGDYDIPVTLKSERADCAGFSDLENELIPVLGGTQVPLRQVAEVVPSVKDGQLVRRNGIYTITVMADVRRDVNVTALTSVIKEKVAAIPLPDKVTLAYGGDDEQDNENLPPIMAALAIADFIIFFILLAHFKRISIALLIFASMTLCVFGTAVGVLIQGVDFGMTCTLGIISLMGIIVRNGIIMIDYAEELRATEKLCVRDAIYHSARRRMRPIFLTSAAASMGVIPMILGKSGLWMPMGTVICYGTLITMLFLLTVLPVAYLVIFRGSSQKRAQLEALEKA